VNVNNIVVFDFETGGDIAYKNGVLDASRVVPIQIACLALDPRKLHVIEGSQFCSLMRPPKGTPLNPKALEVNKLTPEQVWAAPGDWETVWKRFAHHVQRFNPKGSSPFTAPIAAGKNIRNFDMPIVQWLCDQYGFVDKGGKQTLFNQIKTIDLEDFLFHWFEGNDELPNYKMDTVREYFGLSSEGGHSADVDVDQTATLIRKFLYMYRNLSPKVKFRNSAKAA